MLEAELKTLIVDALMLEDVSAEEIASDAPLFGDGADSLGLDSIDALELAMAIHKAFGVKIAADDEDNKAIFHSVGTLAAHIQSQRTTATQGA